MNLFGTTRWLPWAVAAALALMVAMGAAQMNTAAARRASAGPIDAGQWSAELARTASFGFVDTAGATRTAAPVPGHAAKGASTAL
jgi:hypothetical protein